MMSFERLDVYQVAIDFLGRATQINQSSPKGNADLQDQLKRAATSIPLNIAEAAQGKALLERIVAMLTKLARPKP